MYVFMAQRVPVFVVFLFICSCLLVFNFTCFSFLNCLKTLCVPLQLLPKTSIPSPQPQIHSTTTTNPPSPPRHLGTLAVLAVGMDRPQWGTGLFPASACRQAGTLFLNPGGLITNCCVVASPVGLGSL